MRRPSQEGGVGAELIVKDAFREILRPFPEGPACRFCVHSRLGDFGKPTGAVVGQPRATTNDSASPDDGLACLRPSSCGNQLHPSRQLAFLKSSSFLPRDQAALSKKHDAGAHITLAARIIGCPALVRTREPWSQAGSQLLKFLWFFAVATYVFARTRLVLGSVAHSSCSRRSVFMSLSAPRFAY